MILVTGATGDVGGDVVRQLVTSTVRDVTGVAPRTFAEWVARNVAAFS
jgi:uncharacterized protein YbjT (DUF2867 family)